MVTAVRLTVLTGPIRTGGFVFAGRLAVKWAGLWIALCSCLGANGINLFRATIANWTLIPLPSGCGIWEAPTGPTSTAGWLTRFQRSYPKPRDVW
jgi:hypothetical protein